MSESLIPLSNLHFRCITHIEDDRSQVFLSQGAGHFLWRNKEKKQPRQIRCRGDALVCSQHKHGWTLGRVLQSISILHTFRKTWHGLNPIHQHRAFAAAATSALICMDYGEAFQSTQRARAREEKSSGAEGVRCETWRDVYSQWGSAPGA